MKFLATDANECQGQLSPDGKWMAYVSNENGAYEVYVRPFPSGSGVWRISVDGGREPRWNADGKQIYFIQPLNSEKAILLSAVVESNGSGLRTSTPQSLFEFRPKSFNPATNVFSYVPHPNGRFFVNALVEPGETINVITNWQKAFADKEKSTGH